MLKCWGSCGLLGEVRWPWEALGAIFVEQRFGPSPPKGQGVDRSSPQEGRLFGHPGEKKKSENVGPLVGSLARPGGPGKLWGQPLLKKNLAQAPQSQNSRGGVPPPGYFDFGGLGPNFFSAKVAPRVSQGHRAAPRSPQEDRHFQTFFFPLGVRKVGPLGDWICRLPAPLGGLGQIFVQQRLPPELPMATGPPQGAHKSPNILTKTFEKNREPSSGAKT